MKYRTHDFYFLNQTDLENFTVSVLHLNPELNQKFNILRPGLLKLRIFKKKLNEICIKQKLNMASLFLKAIYLTLIDL